MSFLKRARKEDLISLATDLGEKPAPTFSKIDLVSLIQGNKHYNEDDAKLMLETVVTEREERFKLEAERKETLKLAAEQERLKPAAEQEQLKLAAEQERLKLVAEQERLKMEFQLEKLRMTSDGSKNPKHEKPSCYELNKTVPSFDSGNGNITLFLSLFE
ncbi:hypothetical protein AVEN_184567-1 [Araneus ventricosus]|uniref:Uncharacterized protein n=1 Tax=Araneus ventricosus TaxID=182803 RepID=A0A4Y2G765_ARAVE|nr:hypothetical protein AVEN_184567-1 [Araneus ventricosus]